MKSFIKTLLGGALAAVGLVQAAVFSTAMLAGTAMAQNSPPTHAGTKEVVRTLVGIEAYEPFSYILYSAYRLRSFRKYLITQRGIATAPDGRIFVIDDFGGGRVAVLNAAGDTVSTYRTLGTSPQGIARAPDGRLVCIPDRFNESIRIVVISS